MVSTNHHSASSKSPEQTDLSSVWSRWRPDLIRAAWCLVAGVAAGLLLQSSPIASELINRIDLPLLYRARMFSGNGASMAGNVKLVAFDDAAVSLTGAHEPTLDQLGDVVSLIASRNPAVILINKIFRVPPVGSSKESIESFVQRLRDVRLGRGVPVVAAVYFSPLSSPERIDLRNQPGFLAADNLFLSSLARSTWGLRNDLPLQEQLESIGYPASDINDSAASFLFGPGRNLLPAFSGLAVANHDDASGRIRLLFSAGGGFVLPHIALAPFSDRGLGSGFVRVGSTRAPVNYRGEFLTDWIPRKKINDRTISMKHFIDPAHRQDAAEKTIVNGDIVLIELSATSAGFSSGVLQSPLGWMTNYQALVSTISNFSSGKFVQESNYPGLWIFFAVAASIFLAGLMPPAFGFVSVLVLCSMWFLGAAILFSLSGLAIPCTVPVAAAFLGGVTLSARKAAAAEALAIKLAAAFDGRVTSRTLESVSRKPGLLHIGSREVPVSVMFLDIAGFSLFAERNKAQHVFGYLREFIREASGIVHEHGGVVDKSLGDGLLAYFGYDIENPIDQFDHASRAFECAVRIQEAHLVRNQKALAETAPVLPIRIGVNTATCMLGDLGTDKRMDVTIVGGGVNFAKRLEDACEPGTILISSTTATLAAKDGKNSAFVRKFVRVKHLNALVEAFEYDPLAHAPHLKVKLLEAFRSTIALDRVDRRWIVPDSCKISMTCDLGICEMVNFSGRGFAARLPAAFARGSTITFEISGASGPGAGDRLLQDLRQAGITKIEAEVRWGHAGLGGSVVHGFSIHGFSENQCAIFGRALLDFCFSEEEFKLPRIG
jgi:class 3 adenylate cyclase